MYSPMVMYPSALGRSGRGTTYSSDYISPATRFSDALCAAKASNNLRTSIRSSSDSSYRRMPRSASVNPCYGRSSIASTFVPSASTRAFIRDAFANDPLEDFYSNKTRSSRRERTRDDLIDSIIYTRTPEYRPMPGYREATSWEDRREAYNKMDCDKVYPGIYISNGETIQNVDYLKNLGVTHVLNTAERHVPVNPSKYPMYNISYYGFHVDDHPTANISRYFNRCSDFIEDALSSGGTIVVNCVMGWSRSATVVAAYLVTKKGMTSTQALETIKRNRPIRPNPGFLQQLASYDSLTSKRLIWD